MLRPMGREAKAMQKISSQTALGERGSAGAQWRDSEFMTERGAHRSIRPPSKPKIHREPNHLRRSLYSLLFDEGFRTKNQYGNLWLLLGEYGSEQLACVFLISQCKNVDLGSALDFFFFYLRAQLQTPDHYLYYYTVNILFQYVRTIETWFLAPFD